MPEMQIEVVSTGEYNRDAGPDFFNAMIRIGNTLYAGNVEIHINSSDWYRHAHHYDKAYDSVILQVVLNNDTEVRRTSGEIIPTAEIQFESRLINNYSHLLSNESWIPCQQFLHGIDPLRIRTWLESLCLRRLDQKSLVIERALHKNRNSWEETFYQQLARNFGFSLNGSAFDLLARSLPFRILLRHRDSKFQLESILFGQAGMLDCDNGDDYFKALREEYQFFRRKFRLKPLEKHLWKFLRLRPANFPTIRIAQFAAYLHETPSLFSAILETADMKDIARFFKVSASEYWDTHYVFNKPSEMRVKNLGLFAIRSVIINTVVPVLYFYGRKRSMQEYCEHAVNLLRAIPGETNSVTNKWRKFGIVADNACISQALLQQKNEFCNFRRCLECETGNIIIDRPYTHR
jgi:hypothetical protein